MTKALDILTTHYQRQVGQSFVVPGVTNEDGEPFTIYFDPPTNRQAQTIRGRAGTDEAKLTLYTVIYLAKDKDGNRLFEDNAETVQGLTESVSGAVLGQMAAAIMKVSDLEDLGN
ncbi:MAG: hypothetical protein AAF376_08950 [Pseudomonadota bacterium]